MRAKRATSIGVLSAAALLLPLPYATGAAGAPPDGPRTTTAHEASGGTQSLAFAPAHSDAPRGGRAAREITARSVRPYSLVGVVWERGDAELHGRVQVRTRDAGTGRWSGWHELDAHTGDRPGAAAGRSGDGRGADGQVRGATTPLWAGASDGVQARVLPERTRDGAPDARRLPDGLRLELIDPGPGPGSDSGSGANSGKESKENKESKESKGDKGNKESQGGKGNKGGKEAEQARKAEEERTGHALPALTEEQTRTEYGSSRAHLAPRPRIVTRKGWGADESLRQGEASYTGAPRVAFVHHTAGNNDYDCAQTPSIIRSIYRYHVQSSKWRDIGYNFLVDKCGTVYEGRAGGVAKPVMGAHTYGFNTNSTGIAVIGAFEKDEPPAAALDGVARLAAWRLGLGGVDPAGTNLMTSGGGKYTKGTQVRLHTISGHRDGFDTACPGARLYDKLPRIRQDAAAQQGR